MTSSLGLYLLPAGRDAGFAAFGYLISSMYRALTFRSLVTSLIATCPQSASYRFFPYRHTDK